jgi:aspartyl-tRNA(Asn)/glutamyl-tRNA(Gln) amidotransferase subunit A
VDYLQALNVRARFTAQLQSVFESVDVLVGATLPVLAPQIGEQSVPIDGQLVNVVDALSRLNSPQNMAGIPAMSIPAGFAKSGLPVGFQLIADHGREDQLFALGAAVQRESDWHMRQPPLT